MKLLKKTAGKGILTGQQNGSKQTTQLERIHTITGKYPAVVGFDMLSVAKGDEPYLEASGIKENIDNVETAINWAKNHDCIITYSWHWSSPTGYTDSHSFYNNRTTFSLVDAMNNKSGTDYQLLMEDIDRVAVELKKLADEDIPVLWRPLHEANGSHFWWCAFTNGQGTAEYTAAANAYKELYIAMYNRLTNVHQLNNLIWVWNGEWGPVYPGDEYVDISGIDSYIYGLDYPAGIAGDLSSEYTSIDGITNGEKPLTLSEISCVPNMPTLSQSKTPWLWFLLWNDIADDTTRQTQKMVYDAYNHPYAISEDELSMLFREIDSE